MVMIENFELPWSYMNDLGFMHLSRLSQRLDHKYSITLVVYIQGSDKKYSGIFFFIFFIFKNAQFNWDH